MRVDRIGLEALRAHSEWLRRLARALIAEPAAAEDLAQETWLAALERRPDPSQPLRPWLGAVARNLWRMRLRSAAREEARQLALPEREAAPAADELIARARAGRELADVVLGLDEPYRTALLLRYQQGLPAAEIAARDGVPAGTVRWRLKEALDRVRRALDERHRGSDWRLGLAALTRPIDSHRVAAALGKGAFAMGRAWKAGLGISLLLALLGALAWPRARAVAPSAPEKTGSFVSRPSDELRRAREQADAAAKPPSIELRVETPGGAAVAGAIVELFAQDAASPPAWRLAQSARTGANGLAELPASPGSYRLSAHKDGAGAASRAIAKPPFVSTMQLVLVLRPAEAIAGRLVSRRGEEIPLGRVSLARWASGEHGAASPDGLARETSADARGRFTLDALEPGDYQLEASADGFAAARRFVSAPAPGPLEIALGDSGELQGSVVDEAGRPVADAEVRALGFGGGAARSSATGAYAMELAPRAHRLVALASDGRVAASGEPVMIRAGVTTRAPPLQLGAPASLEGRVLASHERVVPGATVSAVAAAGETVLAQGDSAANGAYRLEHLPPGRYLVRVAAPGFNHVERQLELARAQRASLDFTLSAGGAIEGFVRDGKGAPVADARVLAGPHAGLAYDVAFSAETSTGPDGHYLLDGVAPGPSRLLAMRPGALAGPSRLVDVKEESITSADLALADDGALEGRVSLEGGGPLPSPAVVRIKIDGQQIAEVACAADGSYRAPLAAGDYEVSAKLFRDPPADGGRPVHVSAGETTRADLPIRDRDSADTIRISIADLDGAPAAGATVMIEVETGGRRIGLVQSADPDGLLKLAPWSLIPAQQLQFTAILDGRSGAVTLAPPALQAALQLSPAASLHALVRGADVDSALSVSILPPPEGDNALPLHTPALTVVGDSFTLDALPAVPILLSVSAADGRSAEAQVSLQPGALSEVQLALAASGSIRGRLVDARGQPVPGLVRVDAGNAISAGADGSFGVGNLGPGGHTLSAWLGARYSPLHRDFTLAGGASLELGALVLAPAPAPAAAP